MQVIFETIPTDERLENTVSQAWEETLGDTSVNNRWNRLVNVFCPTGSGGGVDPTCSPHGKGEGTAANPVRCGKDLDCAVTALAAGKHIKLDQPDQVATFLDKLDKIVQRAVALGEKAPAFDLCKVSVPKTNLFCHETIGVPRAKMPQLRGMPVPGSYAATLKPNKKGKVDISREFIDHLKSSGIKVKPDTIRASHLRASQNEIDGARVAQLVKEETIGVRDLRERPIFVSRDNYVLDGHHHWAAIVGRGYARDKDLKVPVYKVDLDIGTAIRMTNEFAAKSGIAPKSVPSATQNRWRRVSNAFCPTGAGGGLDNSCSAKPSGTSGPKLTPAHVGQVLQAMIDLERGAANGALVGARELRGKLKLPKQEFDNLMLEMSRRGYLSLHRHDYVAPKSKSEVDELIYDPGRKSGGSGNHLKGTYYVGAAIRQN